MNEDLKHIGQMFKTKRKELNLTLKEVENSTSIRSGYLEAIEEGRINEFISNVFQPLGFRLKKLSRLPYLCEGDMERSYYFLSDYIFVLEIYWMFRILLFFF